MGDQLLKKLAILFIATITILYAHTTVEEISQLVHKIKEERIGLRPAEIANAKDPFLYFKTRQIKIRKSIVKKNIFFTKHRKRREFVLSAILNDKAKINGKWYTLNDKIGRFKLARIGENFIVLRDKNNNLRLFLRHKKNRHIKFMIK